LFIYKPSKSQLTSYHNTPTEATDQLKMEGLVKLFSLSGKTAVVTGGTRGIGAAMAVALAEAGADIILVQVRD
jgi:NADP-dependent 3-hydroxy acid dehydrogenase YdfG